MNKSYQELVFSLERYSWNKTDEEARDLMWKDISKFLAVLMKNEYIAVVYDDDTDIIVVQFEHSEKTTYYGVVNPYWITEDEYDNVLMNRENKEEEVES